MLICISKNTNKAWWTCLILSYFLLLTYFIVELRKLTKQYDKTLYLCINKSKNCFKKTAIFACDK